MTIADAYSRSYCAQQYDRLKIQPHFL